MRKEKCVRKKSDGCGCRGKEEEGKAVAVMGGYDEGWREGKRSSREQTKDQAGCRRLDTLTPRGGKRTRGAEEEEEDVCNISYDLLTECVAQTG